jgi:site-specific recombinase XerD
MIPLTTARERFITHLSEKGRAGATVIAYSKDIEQLVSYLKKNKSKAMVHEVIKADIEDFLAYLSENNYTKKTISRKINAIKTFFKHLMDEGEIPIRSITDDSAPKTGTISSKDIKQNRIQSFT